MSLSNKLITITGAASGIGLSTARILARRGALLSLADYNASKLQNAHSELASLSSSSKVISTPLDIRDTDSVNKWIHNTKEKFGMYIDGAANVAGFHPLWTPKNVQDISDEEFEEVIAINTTGLFKCLRAQLAEGVLNEKGASIVNVGSVSGLIGFAGDAAYVASKHATHGLTKSVSKEAGKRNIRVNAVAPGQTDTPMVQAMQAENGVLPTPAVSLGRSGMPEEVAELIVWLLGYESRYVTGSIYRIDGGMLE
ncbi:3-oxoacyl-reductase [Aaosphaeria arxii CBS 175.79]|uniref:3-oxoacyl-reductase n=1 Tax=Aaosphaeria arxii CBS 175.79 TaxID=1450172 RepID=A0A6A5Y5R3_9PLEO|nr:3-oxoacyl-reductase [Aaosphaeria arxii CBS 175.79]KAF2019884.1 3-oxoacyl-reductase [Aaosphaeria arxii CBS 175.79]